MDDGIYCEHLKKETNQVIEDVGKARLDIEYKVKIGYYICINVDSIKENRIKLSQMNIIQYIINLVNIPPNTTTIQTPSLAPNILC